MILLSALLAGTLVSLALSARSKQTWQAPPLQAPWVAILAFLPQMILFYLPATRRLLPDPWVAAGLVISQALLLAFCWHNRRLPAFWILATGLVLNLAVILANGGFMPISPETAGRLLPQESLQALSLGERFGGGKDILLLEESTRLALLSDRLLPPGWFPYQEAFSPGDVVVAIGAFLLMALQGRRSPGIRFTHYEEKPC
jgi:hypothetical protein